MLRITKVKPCVLPVSLIILFCGLVVTPLDLLSRYDGGNVTASLHSSVTLTWKVAAISKVEFGTKKKGDDVMEQQLATLRENRLKIFPNVTQYSGRINGSWNLKSLGQVSFTITSIKEVDNRFFIFRFEPNTVAGSPVLDTVRLVVQGLPVVTIAPLSLSVSKDIYATFTCNASGFPVPNIKWKTRNGSSEIEIDADNGKYLINFGFGSSELIIKNATVTDVGYYICEASNFKSVGARAFLGVVSLYLDEDTCPKSIDADIGESRIICCPVKGYPPPDIYWQAPNGTFLHSDDITLPIVLETDDDFGGYRCRAIGLEEEVEDTVTIHKIVLEPIAHNRTIVLTPGDLFTWKKVQGASGYLLRVKETNFTKTTSFLISGNIASAEIPHSSLVFKSRYADEIPPKVTVTIEVVPIGVRGRQSVYDVEIHASATTLAVSSMTLMLSFAFYNLQ